MILFKEANTLTTYLNQQKQHDKVVGFVPTMGALHDGHLSLVEAANQNSDITVCSIFINPAQFNDSKDFEKYPVTTGNDILLLEKAGCDVLFFPSVEEMYPDGNFYVKHYEVSELENVLEGKFRPGHFQGVCRVVDRLLNITQPQKFFLGQKDFQQCLVLKRLIALHHKQVEVMIVPTKRETNGLAMSSRNTRLTTHQHAEAAAIYEMLNYIQRNCKTIASLELEEYATGYLLQHGFHKVDYVSIADANTLQPLNACLSNQKAVALIAAFLGGVRLIDNLILRVNEERKM